MTFRQALLKSGAMPRHTLERSPKAGEMTYRWGEATTAHQAAEPKRKTHGQPSRLRIESGKRR